MTSSTPTQQYALVRLSRMRLETFAQRTGLHPETVRRFVALGLLDGEFDPAGEIWFQPSAVSVVARIHRLRAGLGLNYAAIGLVIDLLDRIEQLEAASRRRRSPQWTQEV